MEPRIRNLLTKIGYPNKEAQFNGRAISPSTATGYAKKHEAERQTLFTTAFQ